ncbi:glycosyl hydrolase family 95 catalytic domain-containing protein [Echinicola shivajiensis]|uniref:glycosyl hydrolase family 95 catalytic domain-containing protein n=1 Tax=Echinicola shivajiensis TaxID=1035916 RepID=UPI001BFBFD03|nr:glycoside hydrolase N-terminal domain-containing protein [Echinicola shivajiensis]
MNKMIVFKSSLNALIIGLALLVSLVGCTQEKPVAKFRGMFSSEPAEKWQDALISGNGEMGVLVFGNPTHEQIIFNHELCYEFIGSEDVEPPSIAAYLPHVRDLMKAGKYDEATRYSYEKAVEEGFGGIMWTDPYHPALLMNVDQKFEGEVEQYKRQVNFETGEITVSWYAGGNDYKRKTFVSRPDRIVVQEYSSSSDIEISMEIGQLIPEVIAQQDKYGESLRIGKSTKSVSGEWMEFRQPYELFGRGYEVIQKVHPSGGYLHALDGKVEISGADKVLIITRIEFLEDFDKSLIPETKGVIDQLGTDYESLLDRHRRVHGEMFNRVRLDLFDEPEQMAYSSEQLIQMQNENQDEIFLPLLQSMFDMGRYTLISSSGNNPPNLMGIWNGEWRPAWSGDFTTDANVNLQIASAAIGDLPEAIDSYMTMLERVMDDWEINARKLYGAEGYLAGTRTSGRRNLHTHFSISFPGQFWLAGAEWLLLPCYEYYQVSGDEVFLKERLLPALEKTVQFFESFLQDYDENGHYYFAPSYSPENSPANIDLQGTANATMDIAAAKEAISNLIRISEELGVHQEKMIHWKSMLEQMPPYLVNSDGALKEWALDDLEDNYDHRHISHLYPVWPGFEINPEETPELFVAASTAMLKKGRGNNSAHGLMHGALIFARLKNGEKVYDNLKFMLRNNYIFSSLFTSHNPDWKIFNADALNSLPAVVLEMLVYSRPGVIELLPAVDEKLTKGSISGVKCRTQATVEELEWDFEKETAKVIISSSVDQGIELFFRKGVKSITDQNGKNYAKSSDISVKVDFHQGEEKTLNISY